MLRMDMRLLLPFIGGFVCGVGSTAITFDKYYDEKMSEQLEQIKKNLESYQKQIDIDKEKKRLEYKPESTESNTEREVGAIAAGERIKIKESWANENHEYVDYTLCYTQKNSGEGFNEPDPSIDTVSDTDQKEITEYSKEIRRSSMPPRILSDREAAMIPDDEYTFVDMYYYMYDDTLVIESKDLDGLWRVVQDPDKLIGDSLTKHGFDSNSEEILRVINYTQKEVYRIKKKWASYSA